MRKRNMSRGDRIRRRSFACETPTHHMPKHKPTKGVINMSEELQSMVQIIELYGRGLGALGRAIRFSAKGAARGVDAAKVKRM